MSSLQDVLEEYQPENDSDKNYTLTDEWKRSSKVKDMSPSQFNILVKNTLVELEVNFDLFTFGHF